MASHARIVVQMGDGYYAVDCATGGQLLHVGAYLIRFYNSRVLANKLINLGDIYSLGPLHSSPNGESHCYAKPRPYVTVTYGRDMGVSLIKTCPRRFNGLGDILNTFSQPNGLIYVWTGGHGWRYYNYSIRSFVSLQDELEGRGILDDLDNDGMTEAWRDEGCPYVECVVEGRTLFMPVKINSLADLERHTAYLENARF